MTVVGGILVPSKPQVLLAPEKNPGWGELRRAMETARERLAELKPDVLMLYSTGWFSVIGHQIQSDPEPTWTHVDYDWHDLGAMEYKFRIDENFATTYQQTATDRGLHARCVNYEGFPIDSGSIAALKLLTPNNEIPASIVSCNMYADRAETIVLGKAVADAAEKMGKRVAVIGVTALSNRHFTEPVEPKDDRISSDKDDEWNRKLLQFLGEGRLEDVSQLARQFTREAHADSKLKALWWMAAAMGQHNRYTGEVLGYAPIMGTGNAVVSLIPTGKTAAAQEFDEDDVEKFVGERSVLGQKEAQGASAPRGETTDG